MRIAILGSAPSSLGLAPFGDQSWRIWGCSPGVYYQCPRVDAWYELHRWEPPVIGVPSKQVQWFSPEYVAWMAMRDPQRCPVWMYAPVPEIPASRALPVEHLKERFGTYFLTSSISIMMACAIEDILEDRAARKGTPREAEQDMIGLWGVDMAATEEYGYQRAGCQYFATKAADLDIAVHVPPESDLLRPMPVYGICESSWWHIKTLTRKRELEGRLNQARSQLQALQHNVAFLEGAVDDTNYHFQTWGEDREGVGMAYDIMAQSPKLQQAVKAVDSEYDDLRQQVIGKDLRIQALEQQLAERCDVVPIKRARKR